MAPPRTPDQLPLFSTPPSAPRKGPPRGAKRQQRVGAEQIPLPLPSRPVLRVVQGEGKGSGHRRGRLVPLPTGSAQRTPLPSRDEITVALLQAGADLVAGRISVAGATAIREAAEEALRSLEAAERDPHCQPRFVRAARALHELRG